MQDSEQRSAVVTGAAGGMGRATCLKLADAGWHVLAIDRNEQTLSSLESERIHALAIDVTADDLPRRVRASLEHLPPVTGLANVVGISKGDRIEALDDDAWAQSFAVNVTPAMRLTRELAAAMRAAGGGSVVNVGSPVGIVGARKPSYSASKAALQGLTVSCARNLGADNIRVNLLLPGPTITGMTADWSPERCADIAQGSFLKRLCTAEEIAAVIVFLLGPDSRCMTGATVDLTAGTMWGH